MSTFLDGPTPRLLAHRGWHTGELQGLENTAAAFSRALDEGIRYLETDVHATADGVLVAFHDTVLDRVTDRAGPIGALSWDEVRRARIGGREPIPRMDELLRDFPDALFNIDAKSDAAVAPLATLLERTRTVDRVCLASFSDARLKALRDRLGPAVAVSLGPRQVTRLVARTRHLPVRTRFPGAVAAQVPLRMGVVPVATPAFIRAAHRRGLEVHVWTVDDPAEVDRLLDLGVEGFVTDRPDVVRAVLQRRGSWPGPV
ncbi:glycerophosphodiester phosphodiesterase [Nakamurella deserti]|uniref:glycerophosphodiester phosphodiesterase n=1 Tax=Nakamurella deserti TaxID=2164074 RepID=UPI000DBE9433|nr:glycerophosphodiester phosphodiesterase [Nakamurella deserti]